MFSKKDFERLWFLYKIESEPKCKKYVEVSDFVGNNIIVSGNVKNW